MEKGNILPHNRRQVLLGGVTGFVFAVIALAPVDILSGLLVSAICTTIYFVVYFVPFSKRLPKNPLWPFIVIVILDFLVITGGNVAFFEVHKWNVTNRDALLDLTTVALQVTVGLVVVRLVTFVCVSKLVSK